MSKTIKVRIAVGVDEKGRWSAAGADGWSEGDCFDCVMESLDGAGVVMTHWVTAELPVPESLEVEGAIELEGTR